MCFFTILYYIEKTELRLCPVFYCSWYRILRTSLRSFLHLLFPLPLALPRCFRIFVLCTLVCAGVQEAPLYCPPFVDNIEVHLKCSLRCYILFLTRKIISVLLFLITACSFSILFFDVILWSIIYNSIISFNTPDEGQMDSQLLHLAISPVAIKFISEWFQSIKTLSISFKKFSYWLYG